MFIPSVTFKAQNSKLRHDCGYEEPLILLLTESARGSDSEDEVLRMKRKNAIASDSEADSDTEVPKGIPVTSFTYVCIYFCLSAFNCSALLTLGIYPRLHDPPTEKSVHIRSVHREVVWILETVYA